jgi:signal transduction histidine kinase
LVLAREEERRRLRRNLHDTIGPTLAALNLKAGAVRALIAREPDAALMQMTELREQIRTVITDIRRVVYDLRPPALDELGMLTAIREQAAQFSMDGLHVSVEAPESLPALPAALEVAAYHIITEALTNVVRHARARQCWIRLSMTDVINIAVTDDGIGMPPMLRAGVGLASIRERAAELGGTCLFEAAPGGGTRVLARLPLSVSALNLDHEGPPLNFAVRAIGNR